jgi:twitching motility protein PilT
MFEGPGISHPDSWRKLLGFATGLILVAGNEASATKLVNATIAEEFVRPGEFSDLDFEGRRWVSVPYQKEPREWMCAALRTHPDVLVFPEIRTLEQLRVVLDAAWTGHLVVTTFDAGGNPLGTLQALLHLVPAEERDDLRGLLHDVLLGVVSL